MPQVSFIHVHLIGGPADGANMPVPQDCIEFWRDYDKDADDRQPHRDLYQFCPSASQRLGRTTFRHHSLKPSLF